MMGPAASAKRRVSMDTLVAVALEFDLPSMLIVEDGFGPFRREGYAEFQFTALGVPMTLRFARKIRTERSALLDLHHPQDSANYTRVQLWFDGPTLQERAGSADYRPLAGELIDLALVVLQRYVSLYRELTGSFRLRAPVRAEVPEFAFVGFLEDGRKVTYLYETPSDQPAEAEHRAAIDAAVRQRFAADYEPDAVQGLAFTVRDLYERGEYWQAAVAVSTLLEAKVARLLRAWFARSGEPPEATDARFVDTDGRLLPSAALLSRYVPQVAGNGELAEAYSRWLASADRLRRSVLLGRSGGIGPAEASEAIVSVSALVNGLEALLAGQDALPGPG